MMERTAIIEIEKRGAGYRVELRDRETAETILTQFVEGTTDAGTPYKHVCKLRLPEGEPTIGFEDDNGAIVFRIGGRIRYRHELPTPVTVAN